MTTRQWLSVHCYYSEPFENFLRHGISPAFETVVKEFGASPYFFIRYWEKGPHIRVRVNIDSRFEPSVHKRLEEVLNTILVESPSSAIDYPATWNSSDFFPNNTLQWIDYCPEIKRYGGPFGIGVAEKQFMLSTETVLEILKVESGYSYERALGAAIQMHLGFVHALGFNSEQARHFFDFVSMCWFSRALPLIGTMDKQQRLARGEKTKTAFLNSYEKQKDMLKTFVSGIRQGLESGMEWEEAWLNRWCSGMETIREDLEILIQNGKLEIPEGPYRGGYEENTIMEAIPILESYVHMTNNRLGIQNKDEAFLGFLISRTLHALGES